jgi:hypothetical protein
LLVQAHRRNSPTRRSPPQQMLPFTSPPGLLPLPEGSSPSETSGGSRSHDWEGANGGASEPCMRPWVGAPVLISSPRGNPLGLQLAMRAADAALMPAPQPSLLHSRADAATQASPNERRALIVAGTRLAPAAPLRTLRAADPRKKAGRDRQESSHMATQPDGFPERGQRSQMAGLSPPCLPCLETSAKAVGRELHGTRHLLLQVKAPLPITGPKVVELRRVAESCLPEGHCGRRFRPHFTTEPQHLAGMTAWAPPERERERESPLIGSLLSQVKAPHCRTPT